MISTYRYVAKNGSYATRWHNVPVEPPSYHKKKLLGDGYITQIKDGHGNDANQNQNPPQHSARLG